MQPPTTTEEAEREETLSQVQQFLHQHAPDKLDHAHKYVESHSQPNSGGYERMWKLLREKYVEVPEGQRATAEEMEEQRTRLAAFYQQHAPDKLDSVEKTIKKYSIAENGGYARMWDLLHKRYLHEDEDEKKADDNEKQKQKEEEQQRQEEEGAAAAVGVQKETGKVRDFLARHAPEKIGSADKYVDKFSKPDSGGFERMWRLLEEKYGESKERETEEGDPEPEQQKQKRKEEGPEDAAKRIEKKDGDHHDSASEKEMDAQRAKVTQFLQERAPEKLSNADKYVDKYANPDSGGYERMWKLLRDKFARDEAAKTEQRRPEEAEKFINEPGNDVGKRKKEAELQKLVQWLEDNAPEKVSSAEKYVEKYSEPGSGGYERMWTLLEEKFGKQQQQQQQHEKKEEDGADDEAEKKRQEFSQLVQDAYNKAPESEATTTPAAAAAEAVSAPEQLQPRQHHEATTGAAFATDEKFSSTFEPPITASSDPREHTEHKKKHDEQEGKPAATVETGRVEEGEAEEETDREHPDNDDDDHHPHHPQAQGRRKKMHREGCRHEEKRRKEELERKRREKLERALKRQEDKAKTEAEEEGSDDDSLLDEAEKKYQGHNIAGKPSLPSRFVNTIKAYVFTLACLIRIRVLERLSDWTHGSSTFTKATFVLELALPLIAAACVIISYAAVGSDRFPPNHFVGDTTRRGGAGGAAPFSLRKELRRSGVCEYPFDERALDGILDPRIKVWTAFTAAPSTATPAPTTPTPFSNDTSSGGGEPQPNPTAETPPQQRQRKSFAGRTSFIEGIPSCARVDLGIDNINFSPQAMWADVEQMECLDDEGIVAYADRAPFSVRYDDAALLRFVSEESFRRMNFVCFSVPTAIALVQKVLNAASSSSSATNAASSLSGNVKYVPDFDTMYVFRRVAHHLLKRGHWSIPDGTAEYSVATALFYGGTQVFVTAKVNSTSPSGGPYTLPPAATTLATAGMAATAGHFFTQSMMEPHVTTLISSFFARASAFQFAFGGLIAQDVGSFTLFPVSQQQQVQLQLACPALTCDARFPTATLVNTTAYASFGALSSITDNIWAVLDAKSFGKVTFPANFIGFTPVADVEIRLNRSVVPPTDVILDTTASYYRQTMERKGGQQMSPRWFENYFYAGFFSLQQLVALSFSHHARRLLEPWRFLGFSYDQEELDGRMANYTVAAMPIRTHRNVEYFLFIGDAAPFIVCLSEVILCFRLICSIRREVGNGMDLLLRVNCNISNFTALLSWILPHMLLQFLYSFLLTVCLFFSTWSSTDFSLIWVVLFMYLTSVSAMTILLAVATSHYASPRETRMGKSVVDAADSKISKSLEAFSSGLQGMLKKGGSYLLSKSRRQQQQQRQSVGGGYDDDDLSDNDSSEDTSDSSSSSSDSNSSSSSSDSNSSSSSSTTSSRGKRNNINIVDQPIPSVSSDADIWCYLSAILLVVASALPFGLPEGVPAVALIVLSAFFAPLSFSTCCRRISEREIESIGLGWRDLRITDDDLISTSHIVTFEEALLLLLLNVASYYVFAAYLHSSFSVRKHILEPILNRTMYRALFRASKLKQGESAQRQKVIQFGGTADTSIGGVASFSLKQRYSQVASLDGVTKITGGKYNVDDVSVVARNQQVLGLVGPHEAGKSLLVDIFVEGATVTSGSVEPPAHRKPYSLFHVPHFDDDGNGPTGDHRNSNSSSGAVEMSQRHSSRGEATSERSVATTNMNGDTREDLSSSSSSSDDSENRKSKKRKLPPKSMRLGVPFHKRFTTSASFGLYRRAFVLWPWLTVRELLTFTARLKRHNKADEPWDPVVVRRDVLEVVEMFRIPSAVLRAPLAKLATDQRERVGIACAFLSRPPLVLLDDPDADAINSGFYFSEGNSGSSGNGDSLNVLLRNMLGRCCGDVPSQSDDGYDVPDPSYNSMSVVTATSSLVQAGSMCDDVAFLSSGRVVNSGPAKRLLVDIAPGGFIVDLHMSHSLWHGDLVGAFCEEVLNAVTSLLEDNSIILVSTEPPHVRMVVPETHHVRGSSSSSLKHQQQQQRQQPNQKTNAHSTLFAFVSIVQEIERRYTIDTSARHNPTTTTTTSSPRRSTTNRWSPLLQLEIANANVEDMFKAIGSATTAASASSRSTTKALIAAAGALPASPQNKRRSSSPSPSRSSTHQQQQRMPPFDATHVSSAYSVTVAETTQHIAGMESDPLLAARRFFAGSLLRTQLPRLLQWRTLIFLLLVPLVLYPITGGLYYGAKMYGANPSIPLSIDMYQGAFGLQRPILDTNPSDPAEALRILLYADCCTDSGLKFFKTINVPISQCSSPLPIDTRHSKTRLDNIASSYRFSQYLLETAPGEAALTRFNGQICMDPFLNLTSLAFFNVSSRHSSAAGLHMAYESLIRFTFLNTLINMTIRSHPLPLSSYERKVTDDVASLVLSLLYALPFALLPSLSFGFLSHYRSRNISRLADGSNAILYLSVFVVDVLIPLVPLFILFVIAYLFEVAELVAPGTYGFVIRAVFLHQLCLSLIGACLAEMMPSVVYSRLSVAALQYGYAVITSLVMVLSVGLAWSVRVSPTADPADGEILRHFLRLLPSFCLGEVFLNLMRLSKDSAGTPVDGGMGLTPSSFESAIGAIGAANEDSKIGEPEVTGYPLMYLGIECAVAFIFLVIFTVKAWRVVVDFFCRNSTDDANDEDGEVDEGSSSKRRKNAALVVDNLCIDLTESLSYKAIHLRKRGGRSHAAVSSSSSSSRHLPDSSFVSRVSFTVKKQETIALVDTASTSTEGAVPERAGCVLAAIAGELSTHEVYPGISAEYKRGRVRIGERFDPIRRADVVDPQERAGGGGGESSTTMYESPQVIPVGYFSSSRHIELFDWATVDANILRCVHLRHRSRFLLAPRHASALLRKVKRICLISDKGDPGSSSSSSSSSSRGFDEAGKSSEQVYRGGGSSAASFLSSRNRNTRPQEQQANKDRGTKRRSIGDTLVSSLTPLEKRKVMIACAIAGFPNVVCLDSPFAGFSSRNDRIAISTIIQNIKTFCNATVILATCHVKETLALCDRVMLLSPFNGSVIFTGTGEDVFRRSKGVASFAPTCASPRDAMLMKAFVDVEFPDAKLLRDGQIALVFSIPYDDNVNTNASALVTASSPSSKKAASSSSLLGEKKIELTSYRLIETAERISKSRSMLFASLVYRFLREMHHFSVSHFVFSSVSIEEASYRVATEGIITAQKQRGDRGGGGGSPTSNTQYQNAGATNPLLLDASDASAQRSNASSLLLPADDNSYSATTTAQQLMFVHYDSLDRSYNNNSSSSKRYDARGNNYEGAHRQRQQLLEEQRQQRQRAEEKQYRNSPNTGKEVSIAHLMRPLLRVPATTTTEGRSTSSSPLSSTDSPPRKPKTFYHNNRHVSSKHDDGDLYDIL